MKVPFTAPSLNSILSGFQKTVEQLDALALANHEKSIEKRNEAVRAVAIADGLDKEAAEASKVATAISRLISGS